MNVAKAMLGPSKLPFYLSANNVVLCAGLQDGSIPSGNFRSVIDWKKQQYLHQAPMEMICVCDIEYTRETEHPEIIRISI